MIDTPKTNARITELMTLAGLLDDKLQMRIINDAQQWQFARELERELTATRNVAIESLREFNDRLIKQQQDFQLQLIRIEDTWREKLQKANNQNRELEMRLYAAQLQLAK